MPTSAPTPNTAPLLPTNTPTTSLPTIGIGKDIIINSIAVKKEIQNVRPTAIEESLIQIDR